jgi:hypothetical protein
MLMPRFVLDNQKLLVRVAGGEVDGFHVAAVDGLLDRVSVLQLADLDLVAALVVQQVLVLQVRRVHDHLRRVAWL